MMAQNDLVVVGIDVAKDKVDACIRSYRRGSTFASAAEGRRELLRGCAEHKVGKAVMEASGGYESDWAKALRDAGIEVRIVDPKRVRDFARSAGRLAKNDTIDAAMIAWFAETFDEAARPGLRCGARGARPDGECAPGLMDLQTKLAKQGEHAAPEAVQKMHARLLKTIAAEMAKLGGCDRGHDQDDAAFRRTRRDHRKRAGPWPDHLRRPDRRPCRNSGQVNNKVAAALLGVAPYDDDSGRRRGERHIKGGRRKDAQHVLHGLPRGGDPAQSGAEGLLRAPDRQGQEAKGGADRLHAQADRHPQHHDRAAPEMGCQPIRGGLIERAHRARSSAERMQSQQTGERTGSRPSAAEGGGAQRQP